MSSSKKGGGTRRVVDYFMSMHYGVCSGPIDSLLEIRIKDLVAWSGDVSANTTLNINAPGLFGGDEKEGGVAGSVDVLCGGPTQVLSDTVASRFGLTGATAPGFRGVLSLFFYGAGKGFMWCQNNPYLPGVAVKVRRAPKGLSSAIATITSANGVVDANPIHIMYECYTNTDWSIGWPSSAFNLSNWGEVAQTIYDEGFGLSLMWSEQLEVEKFVAEIMDHIQALIRENPKTGLLEVKLIRGDYNVDDLFEFNTGNCNVESPERRSLENTTNEIVVTWTNPESESEETVSVQDLGNIAAQGAVISETRNYYGIRNADLAMKVAVRDLTFAAYPTFSCEIHTDRTGTEVLPGDVVRLVWPELGIVKMACRVLTVDRGKPGSGGVVLSVIEDIFGLEQGDYATPVGSLWEDVTAEPTDVAVADFITVPYPMQAPRGLTAQPYPGVYVAALARQNTPDEYKFTMTTEVTLPDLSVVTQDMTSRLFTPMASTTVALNIEATTVLSVAQLGAFSQAPTLASGDMLYIPGPDDANSEFMMLVSYSAGNWTVARGCYDTVPRAWALGARVYLAEDATALDSNVRSPGAAVSYWLRPTTISGTLELVSASERLFTPDERPHLPFRPSNLKIEGDVGFGAYTYGAMPVNVSVSWANRNRTLEDTVTLRWTDATATPEAGQTTTLKLYSSGGTFLMEYTGLTGTSYSIPVLDIVALATTVEIRAFAVRDGLESMAYASRLVNLPAEGYGIGYGVSYG